MVVVPDSDPRRVWGGSLCYHGHRAKWLVHDDEKRQIDFSLFYYYFKILYDAPSLQAPGRDCSLPRQPLRIFAVYTLATVLWGASLRGESRPK